MELNGQPASNSREGRGISKLSWRPCQFFPTPGRPLTSTPEFGANWLPPGK